MSGSVNLLAEILRNAIGTSQRQPDVLEQGQGPLPLSDSLYPRNSARDWEHRLRNAGTGLPGHVVGGALADLMALPAGLERAISGEYNPGDTERMVADAVPGMFNMMLPGVVGKQRGGPLRSIGGVNSATADMDALRAAQEWERRGAGAEEIWQRTGWGRTKGGQWFYEIPDKNLQLRVHEGAPVAGQDNLPGFYTRSRYAPDVEPRAPTLYPYTSQFTNKTAAGDMFEHPELFAAYPELRGLRMDDFAGVGNYGSYHPDTATLALNSGDPKRVRGTLLHELGHAVQDIEGFPHGGNPGQFLPKGFQDWSRGIEKTKQELENSIRAMGHNPASAFMALRSKNPEKLLPFEVRILSDLAAKKPELFQQAQDLTPHLLRIDEVKDKAYRNYRSLHGEQQAEAIANRMKLNPIERRGRPFFEDYSLPESQHLLTPPDTLPEWTGRLK